MDNDTVALKQASLALIELQVRYKEAPILEKLQMRPMINEAINDFAVMQMKLLKEGVIITDADLEELEEIKTALEKAKTQTKLLQAGARFLGFVAKFA